MKNPMSNSQPGSYPHLAWLGTEHQAAWHASYAQILDGLDADQFLGSEYLMVTDEGALRVLAPLFRSCTYRGIDAPLYQGDLLILEVPQGQWKLREPDGDAGLRAITFSAWNGPAADA